VNLMTIRFAARADYPALAQLYNQSALSTLAESDLLHQDQLWAMSGPTLRMALDGPDGGLAASGALWVDSWRPAGTMLIQVTVDSARRGAGLGTRLYAALEEQARGLGARVIESKCRDDAPECLKWAEQRGFRVIDRYFRSELDLTGFEPDAFAGALQAAEAAGYRFITLADVDLAAGQRRLYEVDMECAFDEPGISHETWPPLTYEEYAQEMFPPHRFDPAAVAIAVLGDEWAGFSSLHFPPDKPDLAWVSFTGVRRAHRGRGLAQALKLLTSRYALQRGCTRVGTSNNEHNPAMLAVNRKFGFVPVPGMYILQKTL
jgi:GNAT superfamily N-acetyltransferase